MNRISKHRSFLEALRRGNKVQRCGLLKGAGRELIDCICEICLNTLNGNVNISKSHKNKLKKYKSLLRTLSDKTKSHSHRKRLILKQRGGAFFPLLLGPLLSILSSALLGGGS